jgi:single-strand DNA-binding protein
MASVNKVIILGNCGRDPEVRTFPNGDKVANIAVATTDKWKDKQSGELMESTEWHRIQFNGRLAEIAGEYLRKGDPVYVEGQIRSRKFTDKDGVERTVTEIRADRLQLLGSRREGGGQDQGASQQRQQPQQRTGGYGDRGNSSRQQPQRQAPAQNKTGGGDSGWDDFESDIPL